MGRILPRCWQAVASAPGTGAISLGSALTGYQTLAAAGAANGDVVSYWAVDGSAWECGQGTYSTSVPSLTRSTFEASSTGSALNLSAAATVYCAPTPRDITPKFAIDKPLDDQIFDASGTWTKPAVAGSWALIELWGGGMGGGKNATSGLRYGGTGGSYQQYLIPLADLPATASATVGAGGAGATSNATRGSAGGTTSFLGLSCLGGTEDVHGDASNYPSGLTTPAPVYKSLVEFYAVDTISGVGTSSVVAATSPVADAQEQGGRGPVSGAVGNSLFSGGRGAGATAANVKLAASASTNGGSGADSATTTNNTAGDAGSAPGGGGSAGTGTGNGGAGAAGRVRVRIY